MAIEGRQLSIAEGAEVCDENGHKLGTVVAVEPGYVVVEKGWFFPTDHSIPLGAIAASDGGKLYLAVGKDAALDQGWAAVPAAGGTTGVNSGAGDETIRVPAHEEGVAVTARERDLGTVRIVQDAGGGEPAVEVRVADGRVRVDRPAADDEVVVEERTIVVPLRSERVGRDEQLRVVEEVEIVKETVRRTETVSGSVRREDVHVREEPV